MAQPRHLQLHLCGGAPGRGMAPALALSGLGSGQGTHTTSGVRQHQI